MEYRKLGKSGLKISSLSFGSWVTFSNQVDVTLAKKMMSFAYDQGINFFDNAEVYAQGDSERIMGKVFKEMEWERDTYIVSSKVFWGGKKPTQIGLSRKHIFEACHAALKRLQVDYLDLYFCHRPDPDTPVEEIVWAMNDLLRQGKILYWGTSEWPAHSIYEACEFANKFHLIRPTMEQPEYNMFHREKVEEEFTYLYNEFGLGTTIWSPLASGILTGKYEKGIPEKSRANLPGYDWMKERFLSDEGQQKIKKAAQLKLLAQELGMSLSQMSIAWCLKNPNVSTVILGASRFEQLQENIKAIDFVDKLDKNILKKIDDILA